ncbi:phage tail protein [bacterium]|nr:phage tail protein [bacterium]
MSTFIKGNAVILDVWDDTIYRPVACLTSNSIAHSREVIESKTKCEPDTVEKQSGTYSYEISLEGQKIDTTSVGAEITKASYDYLEAIIEDGSAITWRMSTGITDVPYKYGTAILNDLSSDDPAGEEIGTFSGSLSGIGKTVIVDPNI